MNNSFNSKSCIPVNDVHENQDRIDTHECINSGGKKSMQFIGKQVGKPAAGRFRYKRFCEFLIT